MQCRIRDVVALAENKSGRVSITFSAMSRTSRRLHRDRYIAAKRKVVGSFRVLQQRGLLHIADLEPRSKYALI